jgi:hypothetical protein
MITITDSRIEEYLLKLQPEDDPNIARDGEVSFRLSHAAMRECRSK